MLPFDRKNSFKLRCLALYNFIKKCAAPYLLALREGLIWVVPCLMVSSFALFIASMGEFVLGERPEWVEMSYNIHNVVVNLFPYLVTAAIAYILAMQWRLPRPPIALLAILYLAVMENTFLINDIGESLNIIMAIVTPLYTIPILSYLLRFSCFKLTQINSGGKIVKESLNLIIPAIIAGSIIMMINGLILTSFNHINLIDASKLDYVNEPYEFGMLFATYNSLLWFLGIHGYYALLPLMNLLQEASQFNHAASLAGSDIPHIMNLPFMGVFVFIGGSGATLSLIVSILLFAKQNFLRVIAVASIPIALFNVNEILLFGLPIIFNPRMFLPFLIAPIVNVLIGLTAISLGYVISPSFPVPFNSPVFINAWLATGGDFKAVLLQIINIMVGVIIYLPAVFSMDKFYSNRTIIISSLDTTYQRLQESAAVLGEDPISLSQIKERHIVDVEQKLTHISHNEFCLEYQPQISTVSGKVVGCEALIRTIDEKGQLQSQASFFPWLEKAGLMKDLDLWVFKQCVKDVAVWQAQGVELPLSINLGATTIIDTDYMERIEQIIQPIAHTVHIEITEETLLEDEQALKSAFARLHKMGASIYIDDFGTGYSSLSYLNKFEIDAIKIDRSFVVALSTEKGKKICSSLFNIASLLDLKVVVEGVENAEQLASIPKLESVSVQGWFYSKSLNLKDFCYYYHRKNSADS